MCFTGVLAFGHAHGYRSNNDVSINDDKRAISIWKNVVFCAKQRVSVKLPLSALHCVNTVSPFKVWNVCFHTDPHTLSVRLAPTQTRAYSLGFNHGKDNNI